MAKPKLTPKQRRLITEIEEISATVQMDHWNIDDYVEEGRTTILELIIRQLVQSEVITRYTFIDEALSLIICHFYFKLPKQEFTFKRLWKTKKFRIFANYLLDEIYLMKKLAIVNEIREVPSPVKSAVARINDVRNAVAHSFFPENRRQYRAHRKVMYRNSDIFSREGIAKLLEDAQLAQDYLLREAFGVDIADARVEMKAADVSAV